jgi:hypothetical protein
LRIYVAFDGSNIKTRCRQVGYQKKKKIMAPMPLMYF